MSLIIFILVLSALVVVHEWGHYMAARLFGVKVERFSVGFGKKLWSRKSGDTEFMVCAIPLGGYVKMAGEDRSQCQGKPDEFFSLPIWKRAIVVLMGPITNFVFAFLCFFVIFVTGFPMISPKVGKVLEGSPAQVAGLLAGDRVLAIDAKTIKGWEDIQDYVAYSSGASLRFVIQRGKAEIVKDIVPAQKTRKNIFGQVEKVRQIGIQQAEEFIMVRHGPIESVAKAYQQVIKITVMTLQAFYYILSGTMPAKDALTGPIGIFGVVRDMAALGLPYLLMITAVISANLAIFNLFPIPVLDGGHLFFMSIEAIRRKPLPLKVEEGFTRVGFSLLMCLMAFVFYNDLARIGVIDKIVLFFSRIKA